MPINTIQRFCEIFTKVYKKAPERLESSINSEGKYIAKKLELDNRIEQLPKR